MCCFFGLKYGWWIHQDKPLTDDKKQWWDIDGKTILGTRAYYNKDLMFHEDWNWIMEVLEKIEKENGTSIVSGPAKGSSMVIHLGSLQAISGQSKKSKKEAVIHAINNFLDSM